MKATSMNKSLMRVERLLMLVGAALMSTTVAIVLHGSASSRLALWEFDQAQASTFREASTVPSDDESEFSLWDKRRFQAYRESPLGWVAPPMAALRIEKLRLRVPVFEGTGDVVLNRGVGWITGTAKPGEPGNIGLAGHRDGFHGEPGFPEKSRGRSGDRLHENEIRRRGEKCRRRPGGDQLRFDGALLRCGEKRRVHRFHH